MGSTNPKAHSGKRTPRRHSARPDNLNQLAQANPRVICPHCLERFGLNDAQKIPHGRACPRCKSAIRAKSYESRRAEIKNTAREAEELAAPYRQKRDKFAKKQFNTRWKPLKWYYLLHIKHINHAYGALIDSAAKAQEDLGKLNDFAQSEYYTSDWYAFTGKNLQRDSTGPLKRYRLTAGYKEGRLCVSAASGGAIANGLEAEWHVFDLLERAIVEKVLPPDTILCPNVFIRNPNADEQEFGYASGWSNSGRFFHGRTRAPRPLYSQIDLIAVTQAAVIVFEVKRRRSSITVDAKGHVTGTKHSSDEIIDMTRDKRQCENHASALATKFPALSFDQIYEATVYVDAIDFKSEDPGFADNAGIFCADSPHADELLHAIKSCLEQTAKGPSIDAEVLNSVIDALRGECSDQNGRKEYLHLERIETIKSYRNAH